MGWGAKVALAFTLAATACTAGHPVVHSVATPSRPSSALRAAESTFAPFAADAGRRLLVPLTRGTGSRVIHLQRFLGDYEIQFQCVGVGAVAYQLDAAVQPWRCGEPILDEETASGEPLRSLRIRAGRSQRWQVLVQAGHTPVE
jgi:hypothetical protein